MKKIFFIGLTILAFNIKANACNYEAVKTAQELLDLAKTNFEKGIATATDTFEAQSHLLELQMCQTPNDKAICKDLTSSLNKTYEAEKVGYTVGVRTMTDILNAHDKLVKAKVKCGL